MEDGIQKPEEVKISRRTYHKQKSLITCNKYSNTVMHVETQYLIKYYKLGTKSNKEPNCLLY